MIRIHNDMLGQSRAMAAVIAEAKWVAGGDSKVLITGESGVGKELLARFIHENSARNRKPLASLNCAGIPDTLLESELFGHVRGSFTDAQDRVGLFERANGGTVLLDEIGEMGARMQALLLRVLESGEIQRIGSDRLSHAVDVRVISATNRDLLEQTREKTFRLDLYYRLNVVNLIIPPLRERREDVRLLVDHYLTVMSEHFRLPRCTVDEAAYAKLEAYNWPGNIRELRNVSERLALHFGGLVVRADNLPAEVLHEASTAEPEAVAGRKAVADLCYERMAQRTESFWTAVYNPFMTRDLTRDTVRAIVRRGLSETKGSYKSLAPLFNIAPSEYRRMLNFLQQHDCHLPFQPFRNNGSDMTADGQASTARPTEPARPVRHAG